MSGQPDRVDENHVEDDVLGDEEVLPEDEEQGEDFLAPSTPKILHPPEFTKNRALLTGGSRFGPWQAILHAGACFSWRKLRRAAAGSVH